MSKILTLIQDLDHVGVGLIMFCFRFCISVFVLFCFVLFVCLFVCFLHSDRRQWQAGFLLSTRLSLISLEGMTKDSKYGVAKT